MNLPALRFTAPDGTPFPNWQTKKLGKVADDLKSCKIYAGEITTSKIGDPAARSCFLSKNSERYLTSSGGVCLKNDATEYVNRFVLEAINGPSFRRLAISMSTGSTQKRIRLKDLRSFPIHTPSIAEQEKIANALAAVDDEITALKGKTAHYEAFKKGLMQQLFPQP